MGVVDGHARNRGFGKNVTVVSAPQNGLSGTKWKIIANTVEDINQKKHNYLRKAKKSTVGCCCRWS